MNLNLNSGIMEFVRDSMPISEVLSTFGTIKEFLRLRNPDKFGPYEISPMYVILFFSVFSDLFTIVDEN